MERNELLRRLAAQFNGTVEMSPTAAKKFKVIENSLDEEKEQNRQVKETLSKLETKFAEWILIANSKVAAMETELENERRSKQELVALVTLCRSTSSTSSMQSVTTPPSFNAVSAVQRSAVPFPLAATKPVDQFCPPLRSTCQFSSDKSPVPAGGLVPTYQEPYVISSMDSSMESMIDLPTVDVVMHDEESSTMAEDVVSTPPAPDAMVYEPTPQTVINPTYEAPQTFLPSLVPEFNVNTSFSISTADSTMLAPVVAPPHVHFAEPIQSSQTYHPSAPPVEVDRPQDGSSQIPTATEDRLVSFEEESYNTRTVRQRQDTPGPSAAPAAAPIIPVVDPRIERNKKYVETMRQQGRGRGGRAMMKNARDAERAWERN